jgi:hypothetical protein
VERISILLKSGRTRKTGHVPTGKGESLLMTGRCEENFLRGLVLPQQAMYACIRLLLQEEQEIETFQIHAALLASEH